jgi:HlyD family secretion protein
MPRTTVLVILVVAGLAVLGAGVWSFRSRGDKGPVFHTVPVKRGNLVATISAAGTVEPEAAVDIGAQVVGVISAFGKDKQGKPIVWGSVVEEGTVLAKIDDSLYVATLETAKAQLEQANAHKISSEANVLQMKASLAQAQADWMRAQKLGPSDALAQSAYDQYQANYEVAKANLAAAQAAVDQAIAAVAQAKAGVDTARINVDYCTIKSPVKGVIIDRQVNVGQTVVSSLSAPSLFIIASDLNHIQVWVSVNEADIGSISKDEPVTFTVDAYPDRVFHGRVGQVRLNATMIQNVVTYTVEVETDNSDGKLLPYLTANAQFQVGRRKGVLLVPNGALHWSPRPGQIAPDSRQESARRDHGSDSTGAYGTIWIEQGKFVRPLRVTTGLTDGASTEVEGSGVTEGLRVVVGEGLREAEAAPSDERNPFAPQIGRAWRSGQSQTAPARGNNEPAK